MPLTTKDKEFLRALRRLLDEEQLAIELKDDGVKRMVLRQNYGDKIAGAFGMTRQGVRWRFHHVFNELYVESLQTILLVESLFGSEVRHQAMAIARERVALHRKAQKLSLHTASRRQSGPKAGALAGPEL